MNETLHQLPMTVRPARGGRFKLAVAGIAFLLVLPAAGLALLNSSFSRDAESSERSAGESNVNPSFSPSGSLQEILAHPDIIPTHDHPLLGRQAPDFKLADTEGKVWNLGELRDGQPVVLIFYYGYHCVSCVRQLFDINRDMPLFRGVGARVVAISADPPELTGRRFQQYGPFGFPVLSDPGNHVAQAYQVVKRTQDGKMPDLLRHGTFVIDRDGTVQWVNVGDAPLRRNPALLYQLARIGGTLP